MTTRALVIIEADHLADARGMLLQPPFNHSAEQAATTFVPAGSPTGDAPATHWWLSSEMSAEAWAACQQVCASLPWAQCSDYDSTQAPAYPKQKLSELGLQPIHSVILP